MENYFYVYVYLDQRKPGIFKFRDIVFEYQPFYIGKGQRKRIKSHFYSSLLNRKSLKSSIIKAIIKNTGELPIHYKIYVDLLELDAFEIEKQFISHFGRKDNDTGILANHTDGGEGQTGAILSHPGKWKKVFQYNLDGTFAKEWASLKAVKETLNINVANIPTSIKRHGTFKGYRWFYDYQGDKIDKKLRWQAPVKYTSIEQIKDGEIINVFSSALEAEIKLKLRKGARNKIYECLSGSNKSAYGYAWRVKNEER